jgi:DNA-binding PucR family transcriptional regulator
METVSRFWNRSTPLALGEPAFGIAGWRQSHRQALDAFYLAQHGQATIVHYRQDCVAAAAAKDSLLRSSLHDLFLKPLKDDPRSSAHFETLRAYLVAERNRASTAAALGVSRQTVGNRLRAIENLLGCTLHSCSPAIEVALQLDELMSIGR